jgi:hypothetical protein
MNCQENTTYCEAAMHGSALACGLGVAWSRQKCWILAKTEGNGRGTWLSATAYLFDMIESGLISISDICCTHKKTNDMLSD